MTARAEQNRTNARASVVYICRAFAGYFVTARYLFPRARRLAAAHANGERIAVGSTNPVKIGAVRAVITSRWPDARVDGIAVASTVSDQPFGDDETIRGAVARAIAARESLDADLGVGIEGGVVEQPDGTMRTCAWAAIVDARAGKASAARCRCRLPARRSRVIRQGVELGHAMDRLIGAHDTKQGAGAVGILTDGLVDRQRAYEVLVSYALAPFLTPDLYASSDR